MDHLQGWGFLSAGVWTSVDVADRPDIESDTFVRNVGHIDTASHYMSLKTSKPAGEGSLTVGVNITHSKAVTIAFFSSPSS